MLFEMSAWQRFFAVYMLSLLSINVSSHEFDLLSSSQLDRFMTSTVLPDDFSLTAIVDAFRRAKEKIARAKASVTRRGLRNSWSYPSSFSHNYFQQSKPLAKQRRTMQEEYEEATRVLRDEYNLSPQQITFGLAEIDLKGIFSNNKVQECENFFSFTHCNPNDPYRTYDGSCNNLEHPSWGMATSCFVRLLKPVYADGISEMRKAISGRDLPSPRTISLLIHNHMDNPNPSVTHIFMQWGQFVTHDISLSPLEQQDDNEPLDCCPPEEANSPECAPILLPSDDPFFSNLGINCLNNARSVICSTCRLGSREHTNQVTAFIDGSMIYSTSGNESNILRDRNGLGTLRSAFRHNSELLPPSLSPDSDRCSFQLPDETCFQGGDTRVNQHLAVTSVHTLLHRHHNQIARKLHAINSKWDDERVFQEARRVVGAQLQMVTYHEFLPIVFGTRGMQMYDLNVGPDSTYTEYNPNLQPMLATEFSSAAFRFGHSTINSFFPEISKNTYFVNKLQNLFNWPFALYQKGTIEKIFRGLFQSPSQQFDRHMVPDVRNHLFQFRGNRSGLDLASLNVLRGRDHGIPPYVDLVKFCGGSNIETFQDLDKLFRNGYRQHFERVYESVKDIDFFSGGLAERPSGEAIIGSTFNCILGIQFYNLKYGDRFFFEHGGQVGSFTPEQLYEIKKTRLAKIICDNTDIDVLQERVMTFPSQRNPEMKCQDLPEVDLQFWKE